MSFWFPSKTYSVSFHCPFPRSCGYPPMSYKCKIHFSRAPWWAFARWLWERRMTK